MSRGRPPLHLSPRALVASALVVVAVYGLGFARTRSAAERLTQDSGRRRPVDMREVTQVLDVARFATDVGNGPVIAPHLEAVPPPSMSAAPGTERPDPRVASTPTAPAPSAASAPLASSPTATASTTPEASAPTLAPVQTSAVQQATSGEGASATGTSAAAADASAQAATAAPEPPKYHDGTFTGWGYCRHGEIQARVVIEHGRIVDAVITKCLTRYSCDWIEKLPGQVVSRQSEEVDYVSGASESADAFYFAIVEALKQAK